MELAGKKVKACTGGFEGKGFKFNEQEELVSDERKKLQKVAFGLHMDSDEEDADVDLDEQIEDLFKSKRTLKDKVEAEQAAAVAAAAVSAIATATGTTSTTANGPTNVASVLATAPSSLAAVADKLKMAKGIAEKVSANKSANKDNVDMTRSIMTGSGQTALNSNVTSKSVAEQIAEKLNMKLNYTKQENALETGSDNFKVFEEELEINDFPQQARWRITSKETISHICEYAEVGITVRGTYFPPSSKEPPLGERKLFLAIESLNEKGLSLAKSEIARIIKEEISKLQNPTVQLMNKTRYKIV
jgi:ATP-dependent RNA helicase DDX46/PRP5